MCRERNSRPPTLADKMLGNEQSRGMRRPALRALLLATALLLLGAGAARAADPIEGIWSFNGGQVAIQRQADGTFMGTVVKDTKFAICTHPAGEAMWTKMAAQPDGSYYGLHQWYLGGVDGQPCSKNPELGLTTWRVLSSGPGSKFLRVCFSSPGTAAQPTISSDGVAANDDAGCSDSELISELPSVAPNPVTAIQLPPAGVCLRKQLKVVLKDPEGDPIKKAQVFLKSAGVRRAAKLKRHGSRIVATLGLSGLPSTSVRVFASFETVLGQKVKRKRAYSTLCGSGARPKKHKHAA
jgi:hypothetical protein